MRTIFGLPDSIKACTDAAAAQGAPGDTSLRDEALRIVGDLEGLPTLPAVVAELLERAEDPNATVSSITEIVEKDPSLNAKVLKLVNSAFYALPRRIGSLKTAVSILGFNALRNIVLAASVFKLFGKRRIGFDTEGLWIHSLCCGVGCTALFRRMNQFGERSDFVYGLLHDIGKIVMAVHMEGTMKGVLDAARRKHVTFHEAEKQLGPLTHADIGAALAEQWRFPESLVAAIRCHHAPELAGPAVYEASVVHVSDTLVRALQLGWCGDESITPVSEVAWQMLRISDAEVGDVMDHIQSGLHAAGAFVDLITEK